MDVLRQNDMARLNVGGKVFITRRATLCAIEGSILEKMFRPDSDFTLPPQIILGNDVREVFIDRSPVGFELILEYLRNGGNIRSFDANDRQDRTLVELLRTEANFYGFTELKERCDAMIQRQERQEPERQEPEHQEKEAAARRREQRARDGEGGEAERQRLVAREEDRAAREEELRHEQPRHEQRPALPVVRRPPAQVATSTLGGDLRGLRRDFRRDFRWVFRAAREDELRHEQPRHEQRPASPVVRRPPAPVATRTLGGHLSSGSDGEDPIDSENILPSSVGGAGFTNVSLTGVSLTQPSVAARGWSAQEFREEMKRRFNTEITLIDVDPDIGAKAHGWNGKKIEEVCIIRFGSVYFCTEKSKANVAAVSLVKHFKAPKENRLRCERCQEVFESHQLYLCHKADNSRRSVCKAKTYDKDMLGSYVNHWAPWTFWLDENVVDMLVDSTPLGGCPQDLILPTCMPYWTGSYTSRAASSRSAAEIQRIKTNKQHRGDQLRRVLHLQYKNLQEKDGETAVSKSWKPDVVSVWEKTKGTAPSFVTMPWLKDFDKWESDALKALGVEEPSADDAEASAFDRVYGNGNV